MGQQPDPERPALGVQLEGVRVIGLSDGSPAERAGIKVGDVIKKIGKKRVDGFGDLIGALEAGLGGAARIGGEGQEGRRARGRGPTAGSG